MTFFRPPRLINKLCVKLRAFHHTYFGTCPSLPYLNYDYNHESGTMNIRCRNLLGLLSTLIDVLFAKKVIWLDNLNKTLWLWYWQKGAEAGVVNCQLLFVFIKKNLGIWISKGKFLFLFNLSIWFIFLT